MQFRIAAIPFNEALSCRAFVEPSAVGVREWQQVRLRLTVKRLIERYCV